MKIYSFNQKIKRVEFDNLRINKDEFYWIHLNYDELVKINDSYFNFSTSSLDECKSKEQLAKVDFYDEYTFIVLNALKYENGKVIPDEFNIFLGEKYIVTVSKDEVKVIDELQQELENYENSLFFSKDKSPSRILYYILGRIIQYDYDIINKLENAADSLEIHIMKNPDRQFINALIHLRHQVHTLRRCIAPLRYIGDNLISNENGIINHESIKNFHHINSRIDKLMFSLEGLVQYIVLVREAFESEMANKTNELMKLFTLITMFFSPLTLITGIYGMNFKIPECNWEYGYLFVITLMTVITASLFIYFKKKKWL